MAFTVSLKAKFAQEFTHLVAEQQDKVLGFVEIFERHGLEDFEQYPGKIAPSWKGLAPSSRHYRYTRDNCLWHYHIGLPDYRQSVSGKYFTSDWLLHFQWREWDRNGTHIALVDLYQHYTWDGEFWLPQPEYLAEPGE